MKIINWSLITIFLVGCASLSEERWHELKYFLRDNRTILKGGMERTIFPYMDGPNTETVEPTDWGYFKLDKGEMPKIIDFYDMGKKVEYFGFFASGKLRWKCNGDFKPGKTINISVDAIAEDTGSSKDMSFYILPEKKGINENDLDFRQQANFVTKILKKRGYTFADNPASSSRVILIRSDMGDPKSQTYISSDPVSRLAVDIPQSTLTTTTISNLPGSPGAGTIQSTTNSNNLIPQLREVYGGQITRTEVVVSVGKSFTMEAIDFDHFKKTNQTKPIWKITVFTVESDDDFRHRIPILTFAAATYAGADLPERLSFSINENHPSILSLEDQRAIDFSKCKELKNGEPFE